MAKSKAVAKKEGNLPEQTSAYEEEAGAGFEGMTADEMIIPRITILQKMSPQVDEDKESYVDGAKAGKMINSVTGQLYEKEGFNFIPVHRVHEFLEFVPRDQGGGFQGSHSPDSQLVAKAREAAEGNWGKLKVQEGDGAGNDLIETFQVYGLVVEEDMFYPSVLSFSSSNIRVFKRWMTMARSVQLRGDDGHRFTPPLFAHVYRVSTQYQENAKGSWYSYQVVWAETNARDSRLPADSELFQAAKGVRDMVLSGAARTNYNKSGDDGKDEVDDVF